MTQTVYTIGHSNGTTERLLGLLTQHGITAIADVRSRPYSRFNPQFNREELAGALKAAGIGYVFLGQELGARSDDPSCYRDGRAQYVLMAQTPLFARGIERLLAGEAHRAAILCAEKEPLTCHRSMLIGRYLHERNVRAPHSGGRRSGGAPFVARSPTRIARHAGRSSFPFQGRADCDGLRKAGGRY